MFIGIVALSIMIYPGGFDFVNDYLSNLGRTVTKDLDPNPTSSVMFTVAMIFGAIVSLSFWLFSLNIFNAFYTSGYKWLPMLGGAIGAVSTPFMALIGVFPVNLEPANHYLVGMIFFSLAGVAMTTYALFFIWLFLSSYSGIKLLVYGAISLLIPLLAGFALTFASAIPSWIIILIVGSGIVLSLILGTKFPDFDDFLSHIASVTILVLMIAIVVVLFGAGLFPLLEASFILGIIGFMMASHFRLWDDVKG